MDLEEGPRGWAKGRVHAGSSEANSAHPRRPWGPGTAESGALLGGDRHHAAGAGTAQSDCQGRGACQRHDSPNYRGRAYQEKATGLRYLTLLADIKERRRIRYRADYHRVDPTAGHSRAGRTSPLDESQIR